MLFSRDLLLTKWETELLSVYFSRLEGAEKRGTFALKRRLTLCSFSISQSTELSCTCSREEQQTRDAKALKSKRLITKTDLSMIGVGLSLSISPRFISFHLFQQEAVEYRVRPIPCFKY